MTVLVISDVHANLTALEAVLDDAADADYERVWFLGDAVGYGPDPNECVQRLMDLAPEVWLAGNHDWAALGKLDITEFNPDARRAAEWTADQLDDEVEARLEAADPMTALEDDDVMLVHGSPRHPIWEYILDAGTAAECFRQYEAPLGLFGHTHVPVAYEEVLDGAMRQPLDIGQPLAFEDGRYLVNPGSIGQPRDGDPRAAYLLLDLDARRATLHRVPYDIAAVQDRILEAGLPPRLAARLDYGW